MCTETALLETGARRYVTTAIPYVNAAPHVGFALEVIQADALVRFYRLRGDDVRFQSGTDENSIKNVQAADKAGLPVADLVERNAGRFVALKAHLDLSFDAFTRTSADPRHRRGVESLWQACLARGDVYKRTYHGLYCSGCEQFYKPDELLDGCCPEHGVQPEQIEEENWFFRLSRYADQLRDLYRRRAIVIVPEARRNEILAWIDGPLEDLSISRSAVRARGWGIPVPGDPQQVIYVWFDALGNYVTSLGYGTDEALLAQFWTQARSREHVIGKGISRFHAVYWPAILLSAGLALPTRILVHGYVTVDGRKIGKSAGNAIDPVPLSAEYGADGLRYFLLRHVRTTGDSDFSASRLRQAYRSELAGQLGNLSHRVLTMVERYCGGVVPPPPEHLVERDTLLEHAAGLPTVVATHLQAYAFDRALDAVWVLVATANRYVSDRQPWVLARGIGVDDGERAAATTAELHGCLFCLVASLQTIAGCLAPLLPACSQALAGKLGQTNLAWSTPFKEMIGRTVAAGSPLFPLVDAEPCP